MISSSKLQQLLLQFQALSPKSQFDVGLLADFIISETFEIERKDGNDLSTILGLALQLLHMRMKEANCNVVLSVDSDLTTATGMGCRAIDCGASNPLADALIRLARKVK